MPGRFRRTTRPEPRSVPSRLIALLAHQTCLSFRPWSAPSGRAVRKSLVSTPFPEEPASALAFVPAAERDLTVAGGACFSGFCACSGVENTATDKARKAAEDALTKLAAELEAGKSEALTNYLAVVGRFRRYSWNNVLLIASQRPGATRVAGIHAWNDLGRTVKKGEKGIAIFAPITKRRAPTRDETSIKEPEAQASLRVAGFRTVYVFDVTQTDGKPLPEFAQTTGDPKHLTDRLREFAAQRGITVEYDPSIAPALGISSGGKIRLIPDLSKAEEFAVLAHELAHEMLHHPGEGVVLPKLVRETQAEAVAFVVSHEAGLQTNHAAADYIALYNGDKKTLMESLHAIQETSARILDELFPDQKRVPLQTAEPTLETALSTSQHSPMPASPSGAAPEESLSPGR
jgi:hypothetical protein